MSGILGGVSAQITHQPPAPPANTPAELLSQYIQQPSVTGQEAGAGRFLSSWCEAQGLQVTVFTDQDSSYNFAASLYPLSDPRPNIVLMHHMDVVSAADTLAWERPPFAGAYVQDSVWGRGALDCKGLGTMHLFAMLDFIPLSRRLPLPYNVTMLAVSGEEVGGMNGSAIIVDRYLEALHPAVVFGEGGSGVQDVVPSHPEIPVFGISVAEKSNLWLKLDLSYPSYSHGAAPPRQYANRAMLRALYRLNNVKTPYEFTLVNKRMFRELGELEGGVKGYVLKHINWRIFRPFVRKYFEEQPLLRALVTNTAILTNISNPPGPINQISSKVTAYLDCRLLPGTNRKKFIREIRSGLFEPRFKVTIVDQSPEAPPTPLDEFYEATSAAIQEVYPDAAVMPILFPATTDNNYYRDKSIPTYGIVPALMTEELIASIHGPNERIATTSLKQGVQVFRKLLAHFLGDPTVVQVDVK
ncbi:M20 family metallopeptidase [Catalinimonas alkaloidigena]|nr:M20/M25/M40 family metallo-hydrolase [Catalinimonas alkaloidigena]